MNQDRRKYSREPINIVCTCYVKDAPLSQREFVGELTNISEGGICITVLKNSDSNYPKAREVSIGSVLSFQTVDEYTLLNKEILGIINGTVTVVRISESDDKLRIGCSFNKLDSSTEKYISDKKLISFLNSVSD